jgi:hypothetical protein
MRTIQVCALLAACAGLFGCQTTDEAATEAAQNNAITTKTEADQHFVTSECGKAPPGAIGLVGAPLGLAGWFVATGVAHVADKHECSKEKMPKPSADPDKAKSS